MVFSKVHDKPGDEVCSSSDSESYAGGSVATGKVTQTGRVSAREPECHKRGGRKDALEICQPRKGCTPQNQILALQTGGLYMR